MKIMTRTIYSIIGAIAISLINGCNKNSNPPEYIKDVVAYKEGDGVVVYYVLADANGQMTTAEGVYDLIISQEGNELLSSRREAHSMDFQNTEVGMGAFAHKVLLYPVGRIRYSDFRRFQNDNGVGKVEIRFRQEGKPILSGSTTLMF